MTYCVGEFCKLLLNVLCNMQLAFGYWQMAACMNVLTNLTITLKS